MIRNVAHLSIPELRSLTGPLYIESTSATEVLLPQLANVSTISLLNNTALNRLQFDHLSLVQDSLTIADNPSLQGTIEFLVLDQIQGDLNISGAFSDISTPEIKVIQGSSSVDTSQVGSTVCDRFGPKGSYAGNVIKGSPISCSVNNRDDTDSDRSPDSSASSAPSGSKHSSKTPALSSGAIGALVMGMIVAAVSISAIVFMIMKRRKERQEAMKDKEEEEDTPGLLAVIKSWWERVRSRMPGYRAVTPTQLARDVPEEEEAKGMRAEQPLMEGGLDRTADVPEEKEVKEVAAEQRPVKEESDRTADIPEKKAVEEIPAEHRAVETGTNRSV